MVYFRLQKFCKRVWRMRVNATNTNSKHYCVRCVVWTRHRKNVAQESENYIIWVSDFKKLEGVRHTVI